MSSNLDALLIERNALIIQTYAVQKTINRLTSEIINEMTAERDDWPADAREIVEWALAINFTRNRQPHMSGDPRSRLSSLQRRDMEIARDAVLAALAPYLAARVAAAEEAGARAMRETGADTARNWTSGIKTVAQQDLSAAIRDLPLPHGPLAAAERAAEARGRVAGLREAAAKVRVHATAAKQCSDEGDVIHRIRAEYLAKAFALNAAADDIEAAILALAEKEGA